MKNKSILELFRKIKSKSETLLLDFTQNKIGEDELLDQLQNLLKKRQNTLDKIMDKKREDSQDSRDELNYIVNKIIDIDNELLEILKEIKQKIAKDLNQSVENVNKKKRTRSNFLDIKK